MTEEEKRKDILAYGEGEIVHEIQNSDYGFTNVNTANRKFSNSRIQVATAHFQGQKEMQLCCIAGHCTGRTWLDTIF